MIKALFFASNLPKFLDTSGEHIPLLIKLTTLRQRQSTDPRDKVFVTLGLISERMRDLLVIDYGIGIPELNTKLAALILSLTKRRVFRSACKPSSEMPDMPSRGFLTGQTKGLKRIALSD